MTIGFTLPLDRGNRGYFSVSDDLLTQVKSNFINLVLTIKGERMHNPSFGCDIHNVIFNTNDDTLYSDAREAIEEAVERWMSYIELEEFEIETKDHDKSKYNAKIYIKYRFVENPNLSDEVFIQL